MYTKFGQFIDGKWQQSSSGETYDVINPATEEVIGKASKANSSDVQRALKSAEKGLEIWRNTSPWERSKIIRKISDLTDNQNILTPSQKVDANVLLSVQGCGKFTGNIPPYLICVFNIYFDDFTSISFTTALRNPYAVASYKYTGTINGISDYKIADIEWSSKGVDSKDLDDWVITLNKIRPDFKGFCNMFSTIHWLSWRLH